MRIGLATLLLLLGIAPAASALPPLTLQEASAPVGPDECSPLVRVKYPFLSCATDAEGRRSFANATVAADATWDDDKQIPYGHVWVDGDGAWTRRPAE